MEDRRRAGAISRRQLLGGAGAAGLGWALPGRAGAAEPAAKWDREVDVVVLGSGTGAVAALVAAAAGLEALILEKSAIPGGSTAVSGGVLWVPGNRVMSREGLQDDREGALAYLRQLAEGQADESLIEAFLDRGPDMLDFVETHTSLRWRVSQLMGAVADYHPTWHGSNVRGRSVEPVQAVVAQAGPLLSGGLLTAADARGVPLLTRTPASRLVARDTGMGTEVLGVEALHEGRTLRIRARRGVLVATGGFERNAEMKRHFLRGPSLYTLGAETNTGDGIRLGMSLGADLRNMNEAWGITVYSADAKENGARRAGISLYAQVERRQAGCLCVNRLGERFANEAADYDSTWRTFHTFENWGETGYRNIPAFHLFDQNVREQGTIAARTRDQSLPGWVVTADSLGELADRLGIDRAGLERTVERFNRLAAQGRDPDFHRGESPYDTYGSPDPKTTLAPLARAPFYGAEVAPGDLGTCGGLRVDARARVIDVFDRPIGGLYASGNTAGVGGPGALYGGGGGTLGPAMTFAYIAGRDLVARTSEAS